MTKQIVLANDFFGITAQKEGDRRKRPATKLKPRTYTLSRSFSHKLSVPAAILHLPSPYVPVAGVPLYSDRLRPTYASRLVL